jgi:hypothetical protein
VRPFSLREKARMRESLITAFSGISLTPALSRREREQIGF